MSQRYMYNFQRLSRYSFSLVMVWCLSLISHDLLASHNLAGEIVARRISGNRYLLTLTTYTDPAPKDVDRCKADIEVWSTGVNPQLITILADIPRSNGPVDTSPPSDCPIPNPLAGEEVYITVKKNIYVIEYTFPGPGNYELRFTDLARREDVSNMNDPGNTSFYVESLVSIPNPVIGFNNTPVLLNTPLDEACIGKRWTHNPGGFDPDGDSLVYYLSPSLQYEPAKGIQPQSTGGYIFPDAGDFGNGPLVQDRETGLMTWETPNRKGVYNIAYIVEEWRNGVKLGYVLRDMVIIVKDCQNDPPVIVSITDTCVQAGETLTFDFLSYDPNPEDSLYFQLNNAGIGNNGPFSVTNLPTINGEIIDGELGAIPFRGLPISTQNKLERFPDSIAFIDTVKGTFNWPTVCDNIRSQFYQLDFYAHDDFSYIGSLRSTLLSANHLVAITVVPPPPDLLSATKEERKISLNWLPSDCDNALGYNIYRRLDSVEFIQDSVCCDMSPSQMGYELIGFADGWSTTSFVDSLTEITDLFNTQLCYLVTAVYQDNFNPSIDAKLESCATNQVCVGIQSEVFYMTNDSVSVTDPVNGEIFLSWSQPKSIDSFFPENLTYKLYRGNAQEYPEEEIATLNFSDTTYTDTGLDTENQGYNYRIELLDGIGMPIPTKDSTNIASSIYVSLFGEDGDINLTWTESVPWRNTKYVIFRAESGGAFVRLDSTVGSGGLVHNYIDQGLEKGQEYCYFVRSYGDYDPLVPGIKQNLINDSQEICGTAEDNTPPCFPVFNVIGDCENFEHIVQIAKNEAGCDRDGATISILFSEQENGNYEPVLTLNYSDFRLDTTIVFPVSSSAASSGCYAMITTDSIGNTSELSSPVCVNTCPGLRLGNVFSPNNDGVNDIFTPVFHRDVGLIEFTVFDRWGKKIRTNNTDIDQLWDGRDEGGNEMADGVYYFYIRWTELGLNENVNKESKGWLTLLR